MSVSALSFNMHSQKLNVKYVNVLFRIDGRNFKRSEKRTDVYTMYMSFSALCHFCYALPCSSALNKSFYYKYCERICVGNNTSSF